MPCDICCEKFTIQRRKEIKCRFCQKSACVKCIETYLLNSIHKPHCIHCRKEYPYDFLTENFSKSLINKFRNHLSNINFEREKTRLPEAQQELEKRRTIGEISDQIQELKRAISILKDRQYNIQNGNIKKERVTVTRPCPENECRGFLSSQWKCGICEQKFCSHCHDKLIKDVEHTCNEEKVKSAELIRKQCKNCPQCGASTFKISGCPQMWCTSCHTAWNWNSGRIEDKIIHNPHYFEYLRSHGENVPRNPLDVPCGGLMDYIIFINKLPPHMRWLAGIYRIIRHINHHEITSLNKSIDNNNLDLRIRYLEKQIDEKRFKSTLKRREKIRNRATEYKEIFTMFVRVLTDLLINLQGTLDNRPRFTSKNCDNFIKEYVSLQKYANKHFRIIGRRFKSGRVPQIMRNNRNEFYVS
ncbi:hypothetical protein OAK19_02390 [Aureispira]|nr:hypothetical protein [Aureispira sp.]